MGLGIMETTEKWSTVALDFRGVKRFRGCDLRVNGFR